MAKLVEQTARLRGVISPEGSLRGKLRPEVSLRGRMAMGLVSDRPIYEGDSTVIPTVEEQTMKTRGKVMREDVTIRAIPIYEVSNAAGGATIYIASEVEYG